MAAGTEEERLAELLIAIHERTEEVRHDHQRVIFGTLVGDVPHTQLRELQWMERTIRRIWNMTS
jgi:hypothetical protein